MKTILFWICILEVNQINFSGQEAPKNRLTLLTDLETDRSDSQSFIRILLYSDGIDIEGFVTTITVHKKTRVAPETKHFIVKVTDKGTPALFRYKRVIVRVTPKLQDYSSA